MPSSARAYWDRAALAHPARYSSTRFDRLDDAFFQSGEIDVAGVLVDFALHLAADATVLEIGSGSGRMTRAFARRAKWVHATDVSPAMLDRARENLSDVENVDYTELPGDGSLPFESGSMELVVAFQTMPHVVGAAAQLRYLDEALRITAPRGHTVLQFRRDNPRARALAGIAHLRNAARGIRSGSRWWRGSRVRREDLRARAPQQGIFSHLTLDDRYLWVIASPADPGRQ